MDTNKKKVIFLMGLFLVLPGIIGPHFYSSILSFIVFSVLIRLFFKLGNPIFLIVFIALIFQWLQINIKILYGNFSGHSLEEQFSFYQDVRYLYQANTLSNIGLVFFSCGIFLPLKRKFSTFKYTDLINARYDTKKILIAYVVSSLLISLMLKFRLSIGGLNTLVVTFGKLKWGLLLLAIIYCFHRRQYIKELSLILLIEFFIGITGYMSDFKDIVIIYVISFLSVNLYLKEKVLRRVAILSVVMMFFGLFWTSIKFDYREYLSGGVGSQKVVVDKKEAIIEFYNLTSKITLEDLNSASQMFIDRLSYIEFFSIVLSRIPNYTNHENGRIIKNSILFYLKPRFFFSNKPVIDDSEHSNIYTGLQLVGGGKASHSIGFMTDAYIDFGLYGMFPLLSLIGLAMGFAIKFFMEKSPNFLWGVFFIVPFYFLISVYSFNMIKVVGNFITFFIPVLMIRKTLPKLLDKYLR